eukprot:9542878-Alexandrium_andersonii.AAC.1
MCIRDRSTPPHPRGVAPPWSRPRAPAAGPCRRPPRAASTGRHSRGGKPGAPQRWPDELAPGCTSRGVLAPRPS